MTNTTSLDGWSSRLLVHARPAEAAAIASLPGQAALGAVFMTADPAQARKAIATIRDTSKTAPVTVDANRYSGKNRTLAQAGINPRWIDMQHQMGVTWALTDSGYIGDGDTRGLRVILEATRKISGRTVAVLPLAGSWWDDGPQQVLINEVADHGEPVALVLEHTDDPFSVLRTVRGVVTLLAQVPTPVLIVRTDLSGLGVLAFGGAAAAIGTSSSLRHLYPVPPNGGFGRPAQISMLWPRGLAYRSVDKLTDAIAADPESLNWACDCAVCYGRSIEWILNSGDQHTNAFRHSLAASRALADELESPTLSAEARQLSWLETCRVAQSFSWEVASLSGRAWEPPKALAAWNRALPVPVG